MQSLGAVNRSTFVNDCNTVDSTAPKDPINLACITGQVSSTGDATTHALQRDPKFGTLDELANEGTRAAVHMQAQSTKLFSDALHPGPRRLNAATA
jgi:hypothetical protein